MMAVGVLRDSTPADVNYNKPISLNAHSQSFDNAKTVQRVISWSIAAVTIYSCIEQYQTNISCILVGFLCK